MDSIWAIVILKDCRSRKKGPRSKKVAGKDPGTIPAPEYFFQSQGQRALSTGSSRLTSGGKPVNHGVRLAGLEEPVKSGRKGVGICSDSKQG